jgi:hypothetical protein
MSNAIVTEAEKITSWFKKIFEKLPAWNVTALSALNVAAPYVEGVLEVVDPAVAAIVDPIVPVVQADLGTVSSLLTPGSTVNLSTLLASIKANFSTLLSEAHITDPASVAKGNLFLNKIDAIAGLIPA